MYLLACLYCVACLYYSTHVVHARFFCCVLPEEAQMGIQRSPAIGLQSLVAFQTWECLKLCCPGLEN